MLQKNALSFLCGCLFAAGLMLSGMSNPALVLAFFDVFGQWNGQLLAVMAGAIGVAILPFQWALKHQSTTLDGAPIAWPSADQIDVRLVAGAWLFGLGWGMSGICPAPALSLLAMGQPQSWYFMAAMLLSMWLYDGWSAAKGSRHSTV
jgi:uncharacterized membrane protein YedE/YeeE